MAKQRHNLRLSASKVNKFNYYAICHVFPKTLFLLILLKVTSLPTLHDEGSGF